MDAAQRGDSLGRGPGGKRLPSLLDKLTAGGNASEGDIRSAVDDLYDPDAASGWRTQVALESLSLLCGAGAGRRLTDELVAGDSFLERISLTLQQDLRLQKNNTVWNSEMARSAVHLISRLPDEALCKFFATREATQILHTYVMDHPDLSLRPFVLSRMASACTRCWVLLERRAFVNGGFEEGADAQRYKQRVRDWIHDFYSSVVRLCDDANDTIAAAAFSAIGASLKAHPLCSTAVDGEIKSFWGEEEARGGRRVGGFTSQGGSEQGFNNHKEAFPMQHLGERILRSALPRMQRLIRRQSKITTRRHGPPAIDACASLLIAALRLSTSPTGAPVNSPLLDPPTAVDFLGADSPKAGSNNGVNGNARSHLGEGDDDGVADGDLRRSSSGGRLSPKELAREWVEIGLRGVLEGGDALLAEAAAWATLRVLQSVAMRDLRESTAPRVAEAFLRVLPVTSLTNSSSPSLVNFHAGQQEAAAGAAFALRLATPSAIATIAPHVLAAAEGAPDPRQRLALLSDTFFVLLVRPTVGGGGGACGGRAARSTNDVGIGGGSARQGVSRNGRSGRVSGGVGMGGARRPLVSEVLDREWFVSLMSDTPRGSRRLMFREEAVAALATACAQVLVAGAVAVLSPASRSTPAAGIGSLPFGRGGGGGINATADPSPANNGGLDRAAMAEISRAERARWSDLETWMAASLSTLEVCTRCVTWNSPAGYIAGLAYVRLFSLVLRLLCPAAGENASETSLSGGGRTQKDAAARASALGWGTPVEETLDKLQWGRGRLASVVDDLMWRLREGLPGRDVRLRLLQVTCTHLRVLAFASGDYRVSDDVLMELVSVLQGELGELDAQAGVVTQQPQRAPAMTADYNSAAGGPGSSIRAPGGDSRRPFAPPHSTGGGGSVVNSVQNSYAAGMQPRRASFGEDGEGFAGGGGGGYLSNGANGGVDEAGRNIADVMAHELVVGSLVRLALSAESETAVEVLQVLGHERERARERERLGRGGVGPMEEVVMKGIRVVELLVVGQTGRNQPGDDAAGEGTQGGGSRPNALPGAAMENKSLLKTFLSTMDLGWQAAVQPDERVLGDGKAGAFDHEARAFPFLHRRLRRLLCGRENDTLLKIDPQFSRDGREKDGDDACCFGAEDEEGIFDAHAWQEEAPQCQLNGGSDPVVVTATYVVSYRQGWAVRSSSSGSAGMEGWGAASGSGGGVMLRIRAYNTTNAKLLGFVIRLSFGQGVEAAGMGDGGRVETSVDEVLMPAAAYTLEVPVAPVGGLKDVVVHVTVIFPDAEPEPEFEQEGAAELLGGEGLGAVAGGEGGTTSFCGQDNPSEGVGAGAVGGGGGGSGSVRVTIHAGSYRLPAEAFLGPPSAASWDAFQTVWSGLPYAHAIPVQNCRIPGEEGLLRTAAGVQLAMSVPTSSSSSNDADPRASAVVRCPGGNTDYAVSAAWAFEAWDGSPVLCALTAMKTPFSYVFTASGKDSATRRNGDGGAVGCCEQQQTWCGRMEVRCGSLACAGFAQTSSWRLTRFVTNGVFAPSGDGREQRQQQLYHPGAGSILATPAVGGLNGGHVDWFSRTDVSLPGGQGASRSPVSAPNSPMAARRGDGGRDAIEKAQVLSLVRALKIDGRVDATTR